MKNGYLCQVFETNANKSYIHHITLSVSAAPRCRFSFRSDCFAGLLGKSREIGEESSDGGPFGDIQGGTSREASLRWRALVLRHLVVADRGSQIYSCAISPDGLFLATGSNDTTACVIDAATGGVIYTTEHGRFVRS